MSRKVVIAIDGPAGAGKSTVAKRLAQDLGLSYLDTGAMYRCLALAAHRTGLDPQNAEGASSLLAGLEIAFGEGDPQPVLLNGEDVTTLIRDPAVAELASSLSAHSSVRREMVRRQQAFVAQGGVILEGRDATTVIAPEATVKVYLTASLEERAKRRVSEFEAKGVTGDFRDVRTQIEQRDHRDITREDSPLTVAPDAVVIDSANLTIEEVAAKIRLQIPPDAIA